MLLCADCNRPKNDAFPLEDESFKVNFDKKHEIDNEIPLLINPITEYHADFFRLVFILHPKTINEKIAILLPKKDLDKNSLAYKKAKTTIELYCLDMFYMEFQENLLDGTTKNHIDIINQNTQKIRNKSRLKLLFHFYEELAILAEAKNRPNFNKFWNNFKTEKPRIANLGLAHLIVLGQFEDLAIIS